VKPKRKKFRFASVFRTYSISKQPKQTDLFRNKPKQTETTLNFLKNSQIYYLLNCLGGSSVCFGSIETFCFGIEAKQPKQTVLKQTEKTEKTEKKRKNKKNRKNRKKTKNPKFSVKNNKICSLSNCFGWSFVCFGSIETLKLSVSV
jgi:hypothetical protein